MDFAEFDVRAEFGGDVISALTAEIGMGQQANGSRPVFIVSVLIFFCCNSIWI